tara:strand:+ start:783 stop:1073 length:291 start_codon:yes stop_codon:yes gene_type:complete
MKNDLNEIINQRLKNRLEWQGYLKWLLTHRMLHNRAKREYYKNKPFLNLILKIYFIPYNTLKFFKYVFDQHKYEMISKEIELLNDIKNKQNTKEIE